LLFFCPREISDAIFVIGLFTATTSEPPISNNVRVSSVNVVGKYQYPADVSPLCRVVDEIRKRIVRKPNEWVDAKYVNVSIGGGGDENR